MWHRRAGKDAVSINWCATACFRRVGLYWHVLPTYDQGRKIVWEGITYDGRKFLSAFPGFDDPGGKNSLVKRKRDDKMFLELINGSVYQVVGTDDVDRLVGSNPVGVVFSEYSLHNPKAYDYLRPILAENGGWAVFIYTMRGKNHGYKLLNQAKKLMQSNPKIWFCQDLTVDDTRREDGSPVITPEDIQAERDAGMDEELVLQEFYNSPNAGLVGSYYKKQVRAAYDDKRIGRVPWEPKLPVDTFWDLGIADAMSILYTQRIGNEIRCIDYDEDQGEGLDYYAKLLAEKPYSYGEHHAPHDIKVRELSGGGRSRFEIAASLGIRFRILPKARVEEGINAARAVFPRLYLDEVKCERFIEGVTEYTKEWDDHKQIFKNKPKHDWTSHPADVLRYMAMGYRDKDRNTAQRPTHAVDTVNNTVGPRRSGLMDQGKGMAMMNPRAQDGQSERII